MQFSIGAYTYSVRRRWELTLEGERVDGYAASTSRCIFLDGNLAGKQLEIALRHEHAHAWEFEVGQPRDSESLALFASTVGAAFDKEFVDQGGLGAIEQIPIEGVRPSKRSSPMNNAKFTDRIECGLCAAQIMVGSIASSEPRALPAAGIFVVTRGCQCPVCETVQVWEERCGQDGTPLGEYLNVRILQRHEKAEWLADHIELHCPYQV